MNETRRSSLAAGSSAPLLVVGSLLGNEINARLKPPPFLGDEGDAHPAAFRTVVVHSLVMMWHIRISSLNN